MGDQNETTRHETAKDSEEVLSLQDMSSEEEEVEAHGSTISVAVCATVE